VDTTSFCSLQKQTLQTFVIKKAVLYPPQVIPCGIHGMEGGFRWIPWNFQMDSILFSGWSPYGIYME